MNTQTITIEVNEAAARIYQSASLEERRKIDALLSLKLSELVESARPLQTVMSDLSRRAQERGLTPEILEQLLEDE